ncbi:hypothetical protein N8I77_003346 [Diaporthe amygdali]|uniref:Uncharacterized protein n=1 Tax=Phomopsis amygdali TaxID=1214568 RepID=A0AAD9SK14_PHOAM|nr:hypothetical protein N8I77_003346 [Diaporthe amygdali]
MFDQILRAPPPRPNFHPVHATKFARRLVLAKMAPIVDIYLRQTYSLTIKAMQNISKIADFDPQRLGEKPWQDEWRSEFFNRLWELRGNIELLGFDMESTIRLFQGLADGTSWPEMLNLDMADGGRWRDERRWKHRQIRDQDLDDLEEWKRLEATRKYAAGFIERTTNSYLQAATAEGAKFANLQAKSALPGYSGAQGSTRFWLFWVVSVPIAIVLAATLLYKDIRTYINEHMHRKKRNQSYKEPESQSYRVPTNLSLIDYMFSRRRNG